jgi:hypothetical protein
MQTFSTPEPIILDQSTLTWTRLFFAAMVLLASLTFALGTAFDIQWHDAIGRDRLFTAPLAAILVETNISLRTVSARDHRYRLFKIFQAPVGFVLSGVAGVLGGLAFWLDDVWHASYGIDVALWAPFHVMIIASATLGALGAIFVCAAEYHRFASGRARNWAMVLVIIGFVTMTANVLLLTGTGSIEAGLVEVFGLRFALFPPLIGFTVGCALLGAQLVLRRQGAVAAVALGLGILWFSLFFFVPWAVETNRAIEGQAYRLTASKETLAAITYPIIAIGLGAVLLEVALFVSRIRKGTPQPIWVAPSLPVVAVLLTLAVASDVLVWPASVQLSEPGVNIESVYVTTLPFMALTMIAALLVARALGRASERD